MKLIIIIVSTFNCYHPVGDAVTGKSSRSIVFMAEHTSAFVCSKETDNTIVILWNHSYFF